MEREWSFTRILNWTQSLWLNRKSKMSRPLFLACFVTVLFFVYILITLLRAYPIKGNGDLAAWVQAIGSVGAIVVAVIIMKHQSNIQLASYRREREVFLDTMKAIFEGIKVRLEEANREKVHPFDSKRWNAFQIDLSCLEMTNMEMFGSRELLRSFIESRGNLNLLVKEVACHQSAAGFSVIIGENIQTTLKSVDDFLEKAKQ